MDDTSKSTSQNPILILQDKIGVLERRIFTLWIVCGFFALVTVIEFIQVIKKPTSGNSNETVVINKSAISTPSAPSTAALPPIPRFKIIKYIGAADESSIGPWKVCLEDNGMDPPQTIASLLGNLVLEKDYLSELDQVFLKIRGAGNKIEVYFAPGNVRWGFSEKMPVVIRLEGLTTPLEMPGSSGTRGSYFLPGEYIPTFLYAIGKTKKFRIKYYDTKEEPRVYEFKTDKLSSIVSQE